MIPISLFLICAQLSLIAIGGATAVLPELQREVVDVHGWVGLHTFGALFALGQAAPGPNVLVFTLVGWQVAGPVGAVAATIGVLLPSSMLTWFVEGAWHRLREHRLRRVIRVGLVPVTVGMVMAAAALLAWATTTGVVAGLVTVAVAVAALRTKVHPLWLLGMGAVLGALGVV